MASGKGLSRVQRMRSMALDFETTGPPWGIQKVCSPAGVLNTTGCV